MEGRLFGDGPPFFIEIYSSIQYLHHFFHEKSKFFSENPAFCGIFCFFGRISEERIFGAAKKRSLRENLRFDNSDCRRRKRKENKLSKELTPKEILFCIYYHLDRNAREAAVKSGYGQGGKKAVKLLKRKDISAYIEKLDRESKACTPEVAAGLRRLAFGCVADAVTLLFEPEVSREELIKMDLFNVSEIKRQKGGTIEVKFFDRLKALEKLGEIGSHEDEQASSSLYSAIEKSAKDVTRINDADI